MLSHLATDGWSGGGGFVFSLYIAGASKSGLQ